MDYQNYSEFRQENSSNSPAKDKRSHGLSTAALVMGVLAITTSCCIYSAIIFGALSIIFALLSRGGEMTMDSKAKIGLSLGIIGLILTVVAFIFMFAYTIYYFGSFEELMKYSNEIANRYMMLY